MKQRRHPPLRVSTCPYCGQELVAGEHRSGGLTLMTSIVPWSRADAEDFGIPIHPDQYMVLVEQSAFWVIPLIEQPAWTFR